MLPCLLTVKNTGIHAHRMQGIHVFVYIEYMTTCIQVHRIQRIHLFVYIE